MLKPAFIFVCDGCTRKFIVDVQRIPKGWIEITTPKSFMHLCPDCAVKLKAFCAVKSRAFLRELLHDETRIDEIVDHLTEKKGYEW